MPVNIFEHLNIIRKPLCDTSYTNSYCKNEYIYIYSQVHRCTSVPVCIYAVTLWLIFKLVYPY